MHPACRFGDRWITELLRPLVDVAVEPLPVLAEQVPRAWLDASIHLAEPTVQRSFGEASAALARLDELACFAEQLHAAQLVTATVRRYRKPARFIDEPSMPVWSLLEAQRAGGQPGLWLDQEVDTRRALDVDAA